MNRKAHWNRIYETKTPGDVSWHQRIPTVSLNLIRASGIAPESGVIDIGGGESSLAEHLLEEGYSNLAVLDVSAAALTHARQSMGANADKIEWIEADITDFTPPPGSACGMTARFSISSPPGRTGGSTSKQ